MSESEWIRVTKSNPCPVCERPDWCGVSADGKAAICMRVESSKKTSQGGWLHKLTDESRPKYKPKPKPKPKPKHDIFELNEQYQKKINYTLVRMLAKELGVSGESLYQLQIGYDGRCYTFPMRTANMDICGIKLRAPNKSKYCVPGSQLGIYWPARVGINDPETLVICEGESDTAALLDMEFQAIGRPSCSTGVDIIKTLLASAKRKRDVLIIADCDEWKKRPDGEVFYPGQQGAEVLAKAIYRQTKSLKIITVPDKKDVRQFYCDGGTKEVIMCIAENARFWKL